MRRVTVLLLTIVLACAGLTVGSCPQAHCAMRAPKAMACCKQAAPTERQSLSKPNCCPPVEQIGQRATPPAVDRPADGIVHVASQALPVVLAAPVLVRAGVTPRIEPGLAPPGTLIAQHTALLL